MQLIRRAVPVLLFVTIICFGQACQNSSFGQRADRLFLVSSSKNFLYDLKSPQEKYFLPYVLEEISGLTLTNDGSVLAVDDESGRVFEYDFTKKDITHTITFYKSDDFEGIELVGNEVFVLRSNGDLFYFDYSRNKEAQPLKIETALSSKNDTEGLGYNPLTNQLLIACKEKGGIDDEDVSGRGFYTFNLETRKLDPIPAFVIGPKNLKEFWEANKGFDYDIDRIKFKPSAIAFHPIYHDYYILSSVGKMVIVVSQAGVIKTTYPISPKVLGQPEGICFSPNGDMYISSEGEGDRGYILKFEMETN